MVRERYKQSREETHSLGELLKTGFHQLREIQLLQGGFQALSFLNGFYRSTHCQIPLRELERIASLPKT